MGCVCVTSSEKSKNEVSFAKNEKNKKKKTKLNGITNNYNNLTEENNIPKSSSRKSKAGNEIKNEIKSIKSNTSNNNDKYQKPKKKVKLSLSERNSLNTNVIPKSIRSSPRFTPKDFKTNFLEMLNEARSNPVQFIQRVKDCIKYIKIEDNKSFIEIKDKTLQRINLIKGASAFEDLIANLHSILPLQPFEYKEELEIPIDKENGTKREKLTELLSKQSRDLADKYKSFSFHLDSEVKDPELSLILQLVDDSSFKGRRRRNLLSYNFNCIGITNSDISHQDKFYVYVVFAQK